jgi:hypothetical protein
MRAGRGGLSIRMMQFLEARSFPRVRRARVRFGKSKRLMEASIIEQEESQLKPFARERDQFQNHEANLLRSNSKPEDLIFQKKGIKIPRSTSQNGLQTNTD